MKAGKLKPPPLFRTTTNPSPNNQFISIDADGTPCLHLHARQKLVWDSQARFVAAIAGAQSGKTALGPAFLLREMRRRGPGNYMLVAGTFTLLALQAVPTLERFFDKLLGLGKVVGGTNGGRLVISEEGHRKIWPALPYEETRIVFGYASNPNSLESITAKAAWLDECGASEFKQASHESINSRLAVHQGRILYTSTPYSHNWFKTEVYDRAERNRKAIKEGLPPNPADIGFESFSYESRMNPAFPQAEWDRQQLLLPSWRFDMRYRGLFTRPAGAIYDCFVPEFGSATSFGHLMPGKDFVVPDGWPIYCGIDFGAPNFAAVFLYECLETYTHADGSTRARKMAKPQYVAYSEYRPEESKKMADHVAAMRKILGRSHPTLCVGGAKSEGQWRSELASHGWPTNEPDQKEVEVGITRAYELFNDEPPRLYIMDTCVKLIDELKSYSRPVDDEGNVLEGIEDKDLFHGADSLRYIASWLARKSEPAGAWVF